MERLLALLPADEPMSFDMFDMDTTSAKSDWMVANWLKDDLVGTI